MAGYDEGKLRRMLFQYPGATEESVEVALREYALRATEKRLMMEYRGMSNAQAERSLDRLGYQRPPGWHSVFFYPESMRPRGRFLALAAGAIAATLFLAGCTTPEQRAEMDKAQCAEYGFKPETPEFANCRMELEGRRQAALSEFLESNSRRNAALVNSGPKVCSPVGSSLYCY